MTIGIYALYWEEQDLIYVGQSQNIEKRYKEHLSKMRRKIHTNYRVQEVFEKYGEPVLHILEICDISVLNELEILWTKELDSLNPAIGLNIIEAGCVGFGTNSNNSKWSKVQILRVLRYLSHSPYYTYEEIAEFTKTNTHLVRDICIGKSHLWLKDIYPYNYSRIKLGIEYRNSLGYYNRIYQRDNPVIVSPEHKEYEVLNIREFAKKHNLYNTHLGDVIRGRRKSHKGWTLKPTAV